ncbi:centromere protein H [Astyanax mexicanus]|uniref:Centromere protein H n=1 Tax=Astyanax mexicanus TaxID=7994 RepID=A0A8B9KTF1_ASTMX|nr:centromere protein H [Astyanax mexicanus]
MDPQIGEGAPSNTDPVTAGNDHPPSSVSEGVTPIHLLRMKDIMGNQCFEMNIKVNMGKLQRSCDSFDAESDLSKCENAIEQARVSQFNKTLALNRMQVWNAVIEKILQNNADDLSLKAIVDENAELSEKTMKLVKETRELQDQITDIQKERLEMKGLIKKKMQEITELKKMGENQGQAQKQAVERAENILQKYRKIATISQNVLRGIILATKVNWINDPKLKDVIVGLENIPD